MEPGANIPTEPASGSSKAKAIVDKIRKGFIGFVTLLSEIAVVAYLGGMVGTYLSAKTIQKDCATVNIAKVGETYINCNTIQPKKDPETAPPR